MSNFFSKCCNFFLIKFWFQMLRHWKGMEKKKIENCKIFRTWLFKICKSLKKKVCQILRLHFNPNLNSTGKIFASVLWWIHWRQGIKMFSKTFLVWAWYSSYGRRLVSKRSWVRIPALYTGWTTSGHTGAMDHSANRQSTTGVVCDPYGCVSVDIDRVPMLFSAVVDVSML